MGRVRGACMFVNRSGLLLNNRAQLNYGIAVTDVDGDGAFEIFIAGFTNAPNLVLKWNGSGFENVADPILADIDRQAIGVAACDVDGDGLEEIYVLNTDTFAGHRNALLTGFSIRLRASGTTCSRSSRIRTRST